MGAAAACITMKNVIRSLPAESGERAREPRQLRREDGQREGGREGGSRNWMEQKGGWGSGSGGPARGREHLYYRSLSAAPLFLISQKFPKIFLLHFSLSPPEAQSSFSRSALVR